MMYTNELFFFAHVITIAVSLLFACRTGKHALIALIALQGVLSNLFVTKQMTLFGMNATCSDMFSVGVVFGLNLLQEFYDRDAVKQAIGINFGLILFYLAMSQLHLFYIPCTHDYAHIHFLPLLQVMPRIIIASVSVYLFVQLLDSAIYAALQRSFKERFLVGRNLISLTLSQGMDTILFTYAALYGVVAALGQIIAISFGIKMITILCLTPFITLARRVLR